MQHINYDYYQEDSFEDELNEFISYSEVRNELVQYEQEYNKTHQRNYMEKRDKQNTEFDFNSVECE